MMGNMNRFMQEAMGLVRTGDLQAATSAIQRGLRNASESTQTTADNSVLRGAMIEGQYRVMTDAPDDSSKVRETPEAVNHRVGKGVGGEFLGDRFTCDAGTLEYKLFIPARCASVGAPLIVMLHGCTQSPDDFARGTRMNELAQEHGYVVAYPAQTPSNNAGKCWNWFRSHDQQRDRGEPATIAALTRHLVEGHGLDARRVYVAGLSAGGAMAAVLASTYPDVYAAIGVHSGLPFGAAHDLPSAFAAMKQGAYAGGPSARIEPVPAIVFHGDRDTTVAPCNGAAVVAQCRGDTPSVPGAAVDAKNETVERGSVPGGHRYTRTTFTNANGSVTAEHWLVHGAGHAWFGGDPAGSYTDPSGPDASEHMLRFFSACSRPAIN